MPRPATSPAEWANPPPRRCPISSTAIERSPDRSERALPLQHGDRLGRMAKTVADITMSLDGYVTGPGADPDHGLGIGGEPIHNWVFGDDPVDAAVLREATESTGAVVMGRRLSTSSTARTAGTTRSATARPRTRRRPDRRSSSSRTIRRRRGGLVLASPSRLPLPTRSMPRGRWPETRTSSSWAAATRSGRPSVKD